MTNFIWRIKTIDTYQYEPPGDDLFLRFELRNDCDMTSLEVQLPWTGRLIDLMEQMESEVRKRIDFYLGNTQADD